MLIDRKLELSKLDKEKYSPDAHEYVKLHIQGIQLAE